MLSEEKEIKQIFLLSIYTACKQYRSITPTLSFTFT